MTRSLEELDVAVAALERLNSPLNWVGQIVTYCSGYWDDCTWAYEAKTIIKVKYKSIVVQNENGHKAKAKFSSRTEMIDNVEDWLRRAKNYNTYPGVE